MAHPFNHLAESHDPRDRLLEESLGWEHARVHHLLTRLKYPVSVGREMRNKCRQTFGDSRLRFSVFYDTFPEFPIRLGIHKLKSLAIPYGGGKTGFNYQVHTDPYSFEPSRFKKFDWVPHVIAFREFENAVGVGKEVKLGLLFPRRGFTHGMIIHNDDSERFWSKGLCWVYKDSDAKCESRLYVQPFSALLDGMRAVGVGWKDDEA